MAGKTKQAVAETRDLISAAQTQATALQTQAQAANKQVELAQAQVKATEAAMVAMHTPVLAPSFLGGLAEERSLGGAALSATLRGGDVLDLRFASIDVTGHVQSFIRLERRRPELVFVCCLRNVGLGPAVVEQARLLITQGNRELLAIDGLADNAPVVNDRVLVTFRSRDGRKMRQSEFVAFVAALADAGSRAGLSLQYRSPSSRELRSTTVSYRVSADGSDPFNVVGALLVESFETAGMTNPAQGGVGAAGPGGQG
ncbi:MAG TPA: hypothetical protein VIX86_15630 [Streptosporangiaceae bacterium]